MRKLFITLITMAMVATACTSTTDDSSTPNSSSPRSTIELGRPGLDTSLIASLRAFDACETFLTHLQNNALDVVGPWGLDGNYIYGGIAVTDTLESGNDSASTTAAAAEFAADAPQAARASDLEAGTDFSTTNVQEVGVDEPDLVKTDGRRILAIAQNKLHLVVLEGAGPRLVDSIRLPDDTWVQDMLFDGDRVLLLASSSGGRGTPIAAGRSSLPANGWWPVSVLIQVDIENDRTLQTSRRLYLDGQQLSARVVDGVARIVVQSVPTGLNFVFPEGGGLRAERRAEDANRRVIEDSTIENWLPYFVLEDGSGQVLDEGTLVKCENTYYPEEFSGLNMLNVVTVDIAGAGLSAPDAVSVLADGQIVYASTESLYVATNRWVPWQQFEQAANSGEVIESPTITTGIHKFDITDPTTSTYVASGEVPGSVLNQFSLSEYEGVLRIATTHETQWWDERQESSSSLYTLEPRDGVLEIMGEVNDLGRGERIFAVRYLGDLATVVTFRQTDPLYTIDLADPTNPTVLGELKINGYSAYLHPIGDDLVIGVGQDATDQGQTTGTQVSLFDISDRANPVRIDQWSLPGSYSDTEWDARAFLWWGPSELAVIPVNSWGWNPELDREEAFFGAIGLRVSDGKITEVGRVSQQNPRQVKECYSEDGSVTIGEVDPAAAVGDDLIAPSPGGGDCWEYWDTDWQSQIQRTLVIGDDLFTVSQKGLLSVNLNTFTETGSVAF